MTPHLVDDITRMTDSGNDI
uniref:Uncharacterized protein n=1 Tax=Anguilla anguilla TaxID=7936 RepID=A0A0E9R336_ANGAN